MLSPGGERGLPKQALFDIDPSRRDDLRSGNPLEARFRTFLTNELRDIRLGRIAALRKTWRPGSLSITYGRDWGVVSPDEIPAPVPSGEQEMLDDVAELLRQRSAPGLDLVALFKSILAGEGTRSQRVRFGRAKADQGRQIIMQTIEENADRIVPTFPVPIYGMFTGQRLLDSRIGALVASSFRPCWRGGCRGRGRCS